VRILVVHQHYLVAGQPGGSRFNEMTRLWSQAGHEVEVIAGSLNYATGQVPERLRRRWLATERDGAVTVRRCYVPSSYGRSFLGRMWAFFGFTLSACSAALRARAPDVVVASSPPLVAVLPGFLAARCRRRAVPWVFEVRDLWPESAITTGVIGARSWLARILYALERWACRRASGIVVLTPGIAENILRRGLAPQERVVLIPNGADVELFSPGPPSPELRRKLGWGERFVVLYAGAHGRANAVGQLVQAAERLRAHPEVLIASAGDGPERIRWQDEARARGLDNIQFLGPIPKDEMPELVRAADVGTAVLQRNPTFLTVYPNKIFDYMAAGRPTLLAIDGVARELVCERARAGVFAEPEDAVAFAAAVLALAADRERCAELGRNGREWVVREAARPALAGQYLALLSELRA
jgi:glycosyltransferase involved in cell wall biosynthesis